jgi:hypothetical protein
MYMDISATPQQSMSATASSAPGCADEWTGSSCWESTVEWSVTTATALNSGNWIYPSFTATRTVVSYRYSSSLDVLGK